MNPDNYGTLEPCQRLVAAGIVLETDYVWVMRFHGELWELIPKPETPFRYQVPAPSMAEVWKELPDGITFVRNKRHGDGAWCQYSKPFISTNPTDAMIDLLIWLAEKGKEKP